MYIGLLLHCGLPLFEELMLFVSEITIPLVKCDTEILNVVDHSHSS